MIETEREAETQAEGRLPVVSLIQDLISGSQDHNLR